MRMRSVFSTRLASVTLTGSELADSRPLWRRQCCSVGLSADAPPEAVLHELKLLVLHVGQALAARFQLGFPAHHVLARRDSRPPRLQVVKKLAVLAADRSEERRVGKER